MSGFTEIQAETARCFQAGKLKLKIYSDRRAAGEAAARSFAQLLKQIDHPPASIGVIFATGASQLSVLEALTAIPDLPWKRVRGFHLDEYVGLPADHPASFRRYMREKLTQRIAMQAFFEIDGSGPDPVGVCREYAQELRSTDPQICLLGIGENGHLAFNDPGEADFEDPQDMKVVHLDAMCRQQQTAEGWFKSAGEVPAQALTLTIPTLLRVPHLIVSVPGSRKAHIVRRTIEEAISTDCPSTILRTHPNTTVYLDEESAAELDGIRTLEALTSR